jgi:glycosyltransferase involved in cell wall biosynthesis
MGVSLIIPVRNEEKTIARLLDCVLSQTRPPDEVLIADGGSTDRTVEIANGYARALPLKIFQIGPAFPGKGRNRAIREARFPIIAMTDAGLTLGPDWLASLVRPFEINENTDVVFGGYRPKCDTKFEEAIALFVACSKDAKYDFRFPVMPSMAIKRDVYLQLGGCPEDLRAAEDAVFFRRLFESNARYAVAEKAVVDWEMDSSWRYLARKNFQAAKYGILGGYIPKRSLILLTLYPLLAGLLFAGFMVNGFLLLLPFILFALRVTGSKRMDRELYRSLTGSPGGIFWLSLVTLVSDISHISGNIVGLAKSIAGGSMSLRLWRGARFE